MQAFQTHSINVNTTSIKFVHPENTNLRASITVWLTFCLFCLDSAAMLCLCKFSISFTCLFESKQVKQEVSRTVILPPMESILCSLATLVSLLYSFAQIGWNKSIKISLTAPSKGALDHLPTVWFTLHCRSAATCNRQLFFCSREMGNFLSLQLLQSTETVAATCDK